MNSSFTAVVVLLVSLAASSLAAHASGASLTATVWGVLLLEALLLALLVLQWGRQARQLQDQTALAAFSRDSADVLTRQRQPEGVLREAARLLAGFLGARVFILLPSGDGTCRTIARGEPLSGALPVESGAFEAGPFPSVPFTAGSQASDTREPQPLPDAVRWSALNARPVGPGTVNWPDFPFWYIPFGRLPAEQPVLVVEATADRPVGDMLSFLRSFTDLMAASHDRLQSLQRAHEAELSAERQQLQNRFLASISHDMRTPLAGILGASSTLLEQGDQLEPAQQRHLLEGLHRQVRYLADATDNILSLLRLQQAGPDELQTDWESPEELLGLVLARFPQATAQGRLQASAQPVALLVRANATLVVQALVNLVDNALRLNDSFEPVVLALRAVGTQVEYAVQDRGPGFPPGFDIRSAQRPLRNDHAETQPGSGAGLGLGIVQAIARVHGAHLQAANRPDGGAEVIFLLPGKVWETAGGEALADGA